jgi:serine protease Do
MMKKFKKLLITACFSIVIVVAVLGGAISDRIFGYRVLDRIFPRGNQNNSLSLPFNQKIVSEESVVIDVVDKVSPSVVTINLSTTKTVLPDISQFFGSPFSFDLPQNSQQQKVEQDIATGFVVSKEGLIVTNKHVVSDTNGKYKVITKDNKNYDVIKIYRDPTNDIAILKVNATDLRPVEMGDSSKLKVGQFVIAIGTALGEFRNTVTTGVVSGIGRSISAGSPFQESAEQLDNVIQTDAAINPGNSGGPLINSSGQVIGVNSAVSESGQNIGFALPINLIKDSLENFNQTGQFSRPFLGVRYQMISREVAIMNEVPEGAYIIEVVAGSPAEKSGLKRGDIITKIDGQKLSETITIANIMNKKKVGDILEIAYWRNNSDQTIKVTLQEASQ